jgi:hypothetical protein
MILRDESRSLTKDGFDCAGVKLLMLGNSY